MKILKTTLKDCFLIEPIVFEDYRGWFMESFSKKQLLDNNINLVNEFVQDNHSYTKKKGTIRGMHFQNAPMSQLKIVRCLKGTIFDVVVDLRKESPTYKKWFSVELSAENKKQLLVPRGFAHGFMSMTDDVEIEYKVDNYFSKECDSGIIWNDSEIGIKWPIDIKPILSEKDQNLQTLLEYEGNF